MVNKIAPSIMCAPMFELPKYVQEMEQHNIELQKKYRRVEENEVRYEATLCDDADYIIVAFGCAARIAQKTVSDARKDGVKIGLFRPITLWPFPSTALNELAKGKKGILVAEINAGQMVQDVKLSVRGDIAIEQFGRLGGIVPEPAEIYEAWKTMMKKSRRNKRARCSSTMQLCA